MLLFNIMERRSQNRGRSQDMMQMNPPIYICKDKSLLNAEHCLLQVKREKKSVNPEGDLH